jgi:drug/metabolite transporter (DMT)-like permease
VIGAITPLTFGILLALIAALTTASSHAMLKSGQDSMAVRAMCSATWIVASFIPAIIIGPPDPVLWPWLAGAVGIHAVYSLVLTWSYSLNDFSVAFPIARGTAPVATAMGGVLLLGETLPILAIAGIVGVSTGIIMLVHGRSIGRQGTLAALLAGLLTAAYTVVDAGGMRASTTV